MSTYQYLMPLSSFPISTYTLELHDRPLQSTATRSVRVLENMVIFSIKQRVIMGTKAFKLCTQSITQRRSHHSRTDR